MSNKNIRAREVPQVQATERKVAEISTRPLKLAFVINETLPLTEFLKVVEFNSIIWGGYYNLLIPSNGKELSSSLWQALIDFNPDKVVLCGTISNALVREMNDKVEPFCIWVWSDKLLSEQHVEGNAFDSIPMVYKFLHLQETQRERPLRFGIPKFSRRSPYYMLLAAKFGLLPQSYRAMYFKDLKAQRTSCDDKTFSGYLECIRQKRMASPIETTALDFTPTSFGGPSGFTVVIVSNDSMSDLCLYWNLRRRPSMGRVSAVAIPVSELSKKENVDALANWCNDIVVGTNFMVIASSTLTKQSLLGLRKRLARNLKKEINHVDVCWGSFDFGFFRTTNTTRKETLEIDQGDFRFKTPQTTLGDDVNWGEWVVDVELGERRFGEFQPPAFPGFSRLLANNPPDWHMRAYGLMARLDGSRISYRVRRGQETLAGVIPTADAVFTSLVKSKDYQSLTTDKCRYARGVIRLIGGEGDLHIWRDTGVQDLFYRMARTRDGYTPAEMMAFLKPGNRRDESYSTIERLALRQIFLRGYKIHCPACDLTRWYEIASIRETISCAGCLTQLQPPLEAPFHYRLNDLVARGVQQGTMSVALTLLFLRGLSIFSFMYVPGVEVHKLSRTDIDIIGTCDSHLFVAECKDLREGASVGTINSIVAEFSKLTECALAIGAEMAFLSILRPDVPETLVKKVEALKKKHKNRLAIHLITYDDLKKGKREKPISETTARAHLEMQPSSYTVYDFLPLKRANRKDWVREKGDRAISF